MSNDNITDTPPLKQYIATQTFGELGICCTTLTVGLHYNISKHPKIGIPALLHKLPITKNLTPFREEMQAMDIDLSCVLLSQSLQPIDVIWYGHLRNASQSVRHLGDALHGASDFHSTLIAQEEIRIRLKELHDIHHMVFVLSSHHKYPLALAPKAKLFISDNQGHHPLTYMLDELDKHAHAVLAWHIQRQGDDFCIHALFNPISLDTNPDCFADVLTQAVVEYLTGQVA